MFTSVILPLTIIGLVLIAFILLRQHLFIALRRNIYLYLGTLFILSFLVGAVVLFLCEHNINPHFKDLSTSFWSVTIYTLSGFEDRPPISLLGRIVSVFIFLLALSLMGAVAGKLASTFIRKETIKMPSDIKQQIVLCNWNSSGDRIIKELHSGQAVPNTEIVVISENRINEEELRRSPAYSKVYFIHSDPVLHDVLESARVHLAKSVVILADEESTDPDAKSALVALALKSICLKLGVETLPHIVAEAKNHRKTQHLYNAGVEEIICATDLGLGVLAQCALNAKLSVVYNELLTYGSETNEIYIVPSTSYSPKLIGKSFIEACAILNANRNPNNPSVLIGLRRDDRVLMNPRRGKVGVDRSAITLIDGDALIVISYEPPDLMDLPLT